MTAPELRQQFLNGMSRAATTVNVVATDGVAGRCGVTVSAMSSVSADGDGDVPTMLVCIHNQSRCMPAITENGTFVVNVLREDQTFIADTFAGRRQPSDGDRFSCAQWTWMPSGSPRIVDPLVAFDCEVESITRVGTHYVVIGAVQALFVADTGRPLIFANRSYGSAQRIVPFRPEDARPEDALRIGVLSVFGADVLPPLLNDLQKTHGSTIVDLYEGDHRKIAELLRAGEIDLALLYDFELGDDLSAERLDETPPYALVPAGHELAQQETLRLADLAPYPLVLLDAPPGREYFLSLFEQQGLVPNVAYRPWGVEMARGMVAHGLGYALMTSPRSSDRFAPREDVVARQLVDDLPAARMVLAWRTGDVPPIADVFHELCLSAHEAA
jgi:flavin reductase (DIM6/NTAB) family NADH-FMN oxidoreductase RutF